MFGEFDQHFLIVARFTSGIPPALVDVAMTGAAYPGAAAFGDDATHAVIDGSLHQGLSVLGVDAAPCAVHFDKGDLDHLNPHPRSGA